MVCSKPWEMHHPGRTRRILRQPGKPDAAEDGAVTVKARRKIKDSIIYEEPIETTAFEVGSSPASDLELARAALDAAVDAGTASVLEAGVDNFSCCAKCGGFDYVEPSPEDHAARYVRVQTPEQLARSKRGTCADLAIYNACIINAKRIAK